ncbi:MAG: class I SAM-dependent methyltransferase [Acidobacteria bacterium]|nr:class I SAM-dependent methyltransferase [Acidobacteriota bacterium]
MGKARWGADPEFFGPRHAFREGLLRREIEGHAGPGGGLHLECAAGVGSLSLSLAARGFRVVAADASLRSLSVLGQRVDASGLAAPIHRVAADITRLPFRDGFFASATTAETLEHIPDDGAAVFELARVLAPGGRLAGTVPAAPGQWSAWDDWAGHLRRYTPETMQPLLENAGLEGRARWWGWPMTRLYDGLFLKRINRRRMVSDGPTEADPALRTVGRMGRSPLLVRTVKAILSLDRLFLGTPGGVGLVFSANKPASR